MQDLFTATPEPGEPSGSALDIFTYGGHQVRTVSIDGEPWFVAADVCAVLGITNVGNVLSALDDDERGSIHCADGTSGNPNKAVVNEPGLYSLILRSRKPEAKAFKRWITHDVLPQIRKTGGYSVAHQVPQTYAEALRSYADEVEARQAEQHARELAEQKTAELEPKGAAYDTFIDADGAVSLGTVAKMFNRGRNRMMDDLRALRILIPKGDMRNTPYRAYTHHFRVHAYTYSKDDGTTGTSYTTKVRPSGIEFIARKLGETVRGA